MDLLDPLIHDTSDTRVEGLACSAPLALSVPFLRYAWIGCGRGSFDWSDFMGVCRMSFNSTHTHSLLTPPSISRQQLSLSSACYYIIILSLLFTVELATP